MVCLLNDTKFTCMVISQGGSFNITALPIVLSVTILLIVLYTKLTLY